MFCSVYLYVFRCFVVFVCYFSCILQSLFVCFQVFCSVYLYVFRCFVVFVYMFTGVLQCLFVCLWCFAVFVRLHVFCSVYLYVYGVLQCLFAHRLFFLKRCEHVLWMWIFFSFCALNKTIILHESGQYTFRALFQKNQVPVGNGTQQRRVWKFNARWYLHSNLSLKRFPVLPLNSPPIGLTDDAPFPPIRGDHQEIPLATPLSSRRSMALCPQLVSQGRQNLHCQRPTLGQYNKLQTGDTWRVTHFKTTIVFSYWLIDWWSLI